MKRQWLPVVVVIVLLSCLVLTVVPFARAYSQDASKEPQLRYDIDDHTIPDYLSADEYNSDTIARRAYLEETGLSDLVFQKPDGTYTTLLFPAPVKYEISEGVIRDKSLYITDLLSAQTDPAFGKLSPEQAGRALQTVRKGSVAGDPEKSASYRYALLDTDTRVLFGNSASDGILLTRDGYELEMIPAGTDAQADLTVSDDPSESSGTVVYRSAFGPSAHLYYSPLFAGIKERIVLESETDAGRFDFYVRTSGLDLVEDRGQLSFRDSATGETVGRFGTVLSFDSEGNHSIGKIELNLLPEGGCLVSLIVDPSFLAGASYPVTVDPTVQFTSPSSFEDTGLYSTAAAWNWTFEDFHCLGASPDYYDASFSGQALYKLTGLLPQSFTVTPNRLISCYLHLKTLWGDSLSSFKANPYLKSWSSTWRICDPQYYDYYDSGYLTCETSDVAAYTCFDIDITPIARTWLDDLFGDTYYHTEYGVLLRNAADGGSVYLEALGASNSTYAVLDYAPVMSQEIQKNKFYSLYDPDQYNYSAGTTPTDPTEWIQYKENCYGYALGFVLDGPAAVTPVYGGMSGYKQQPGEMASLADRQAGLVQNPFVPNNPSLSMSNLVCNIELDAARLGYSVTEYVPSGNPEQFGVRNRLIALVVSYQDYHFYVQHSDGTWSHKPGSAPVSNRSLGDNEILMNGNIVSKSRQDIYTNGQIKFFLITKPMVADYPHGEACCSAFWECNHSGDGCGCTGTCNCLPTQLFLKDTAGDTPEQSTSVFTGSKQCQFDFANDVDCFAFCPAVSGTYSFATTSTSNDAYIVGTLYDRFGTVLDESDQTAHIQITRYLTAGQMYYLRLSDYDDYTYPYTLIIQKVS